MDDSELVALFERNGLKCVDAKALALFKDERHRTTIEIEREAGLRQPEVSAACW
jgi:predicted transcriptional regulator